MSADTLFDPTFAGIEATHHPQLELFGDIMDHDQQRDALEELYNAELCPACGSSPCAGGQGKGSCEEPIA